MIGLNKIQLNQATIVQAIQEWVNKRIKVDTPNVLRVEIEHLGASGPVFNVMTDNGPK